MKKTKVAPIPDEEEMDVLIEEDALVALGKTKVAEFEALQKECREIKTPYALKTAKNRRAMKAAEIGTLCEVASLLGLFNYDDFAELIHS